MFNAVNKYVVAGTDTPLDWARSHRLESDPAEAVRRLKMTPGRDLLIQGSGELIHALLAQDLIDRLTLLTFPVVLGRGKRLFDAGSRPRAWRLTECEVTPAGVVVAAYERGGEVPTGSFVDG